MRRLSNSIAVKLTVWFLLLSLFPMAVMGIFVRRTVHEVFAEQVAQEAHAQAGMLAAAIPQAGDAAALQALVQASSTPQRTVFIVDGGRLYLAHSDATRLGRAVADDLPAETVEQVLSGGDGWLVEAEADCLVGYAPVPGKDLTVVVKLDRAALSESTSKIESTALAQLAASLLVISIGGGVAIWVVLGPIQQLTRAAERVGAGDLSMDVDLSEMEGELEVLSIAFNQMAGQLRELIGSLEQRVAERTAQLVAVNEIAQAVNAMLDPAALLQEAVQLIHSRFDLYQATIFLLDRDASPSPQADGAGERLVIAAAEGPAAADLLARRYTLPVGATSMAGYAASYNQPRVAPKVSADPVYFYNPLLPDTCSELALPIAIGDRVLGVLDAQSTLEAVFDENLVRTLQSMASHIATALDNARLYTSVQQELAGRKQAEQLLRESNQREQERRRLSDTLREVAKIVSSTLDQDEVLDLIMTQLDNVVTYHHATVTLLAGGNLTLVAGRDKMGQAITPFVIPVDRYPLNAEALREKRPNLVPDVRRDARWTVTEGTKITRSFVNAPLLVKDRPIGLLGVGRSDDSAYTEEDAQTVFAFANQVAVALEQARLHEFELAQVEREMQIAQQIQASLLPASAPQSPGLDVVGFSRPARHVGGDFYSYFLFDRQLGVAVGDVSGKGMQAALMMALSVGLLTNEMHRKIAPADLLARLNAEIRPHTQRTMMNTALTYLTLEHVDEVWSLCVANAGLVAPLVRRQAGTVEWLDVGGLPLGMLEETSYQELHTVLAPGDEVLLSSDGVVEAMNTAGEMYGFERLAERMAGAPRGRAQAIREWVLADVYTFVGDAEPHDDMTLIVTVVGCA